MKIVFMGTPEFALPALERLLDSRHEVVLVITQPDRPKGRGQKLEPPPVKQLALERNLPVIQPTRAERDQLAGIIRETGAEACVVAAYGMLLPTAVLEATRFGCLNIHPSLLPAYRGSAPVPRCLLDGIDETGVTIMQLVEKMDAGPIIAQQRVEILPDDDAQSVLNLCGVMGADMLLRVLDEAQANGTIESEPQDEAEATYAPPLKKEEGLIPWDETSERIMWRLRALTPWPGAYTYVDGERQLIIRQAEPLWSNEAEELGAEMNQAPVGTVTSLKRGFGFTVKTGDGHLLVTAVRPSGKQEMDADSFVNGRGINAGQKLGPPKE